MSTPNPKWVATELGSALDATWPWGPMGKVWASEIQAVVEAASLGFAQAIRLGWRIWIYGTVRLASIHCSSCPPASYLMAAETTYMFLYMT